MGYGEHRISDVLIYAVAFSLALAIALAPQRASSGPYEAGGNPPPGPRWSNDHHIIDSVTVGPDGCVAPAPGQRAEYVPGRDAWGRPVAPADDHTGFEKSIPVEIDVHLKRKRIGRKRVDVSTGPMIYDPGLNTLNGYPLKRDCTPHFK